MLEGSATRAALKEISVLDFVCFQAGADPDPGKGVDATRRRLERAAVEERDRSRIADGSPRLDTSSSATEKYEEEYVLLLLEMLAYLALPSPLPLLLPALVLVLVDAVASVLVCVMPMNRGTVLLLLFKGSRRLDEDRFDLDLDRDVDEARRRAFEDLLPLDVRRSTTSMVWLLLPLRRSLIVAFLLLLVVCCWSRVLLPSPWTSVSILSILVLMPGVALLPATALTF